MKAGTPYSTLFIEGDTWLHLLHPFSKLSYIPFIGVLVYLLPGEWFVYCFLALINIAILVSAGIFYASWKIIWKTMLPLTLFMVPIHGILYPDNQTVVLNLEWFYLYREGLIFALITLTRLSIVIIASLSFVFTTHPADLISSVAEKSGSPVFAYLIGSPLLLIPAMKNRIAAVQSAQRARGLDTDGNIFKRFFGLLPLIAPLVLGSFTEIEQRSIALELRGFKSSQTKTYVRTVADSGMQKMLRYLMLSASLVIVAYGIWV